jgi:hypothetical protein
MVSKLAISTQNTAVYAIIIKILLFCKNFSPENLLKLPILAPGFGA